jgi:hypothetical protein
MCGCGRASVKATAAAARTAPAEPAHGGQASTALEYRGAQAFLIRGPVTGVGYACYPGATIHVHARDAPALVSSGAFVPRAR